MRQGRVEKILLIPRQFDACRRSISNPFEKETDQFDADVGEKHVTRNVAQKLQEHQFRSCAIVFQISSGSIITCSRRVLVGLVSRIEIISAEPGIQNGHNKIQPGVQRRAEQTERRINVDRR